MLSTFRAIVAGIGFFFVGIGVILGYALLALYLVARGTWRMLAGEAKSRTAAPALQHRVAN